MGPTPCDGCLDGHIECTPAEMKKNGADFIRLATGPVVDDPTCPLLGDRRA